ncbi:MAG TPA: naphthalene 1,2-dioxygenase, partial [Noviherbaspirillum sp.]
VRGAIAAGMRDPIHLYFGVRTPQDVYYADRLAELAHAHENLHVHIVVAGGSGGSGWRRGLVTEAVAQDLTSLAGFRAYLCGAPAMVEAAALLVKARSITADKLHADAFYPALD